MQINRRSESSLYTTTVSGHELTCTFETGDWLSFVSSGRTTNNATAQVIISQYDSSSFQSTTDISLATGNLSVEDEERVTDDGLERQLSATGDANLGDLVARFVFANTDDMRASLAGRTFEHRSNDRYLQFRTHTVKLIGEDTSFRIQASDVDLPDGMELVCYVRDSPDGKWTVHVRGVSTNVTHGFVRLYRSPWRRSKWLDRLVQELGLSNPLLYLRERASASAVWRFVPFAIPFQYVSTVPLSGTDGASFSVTLDISDE